MEIPTSSPYPMIPMQGALHLIAETLEPLPPVTLSTPSALHRVLAEPVHSSVAIPPFRASVKDGYALCVDPSASQPCTTWAIITDQAMLAGASAPAAHLQPGQAVYVTTGAPVPPGTTAVAMVEDCVRNDETDTLTLRSVGDGCNGGGGAQGQDGMTPGTCPRAGTDIREIGSDIAEGQLLLPTGTRLGAAELGILASCAIASVRVLDRPTIGVLSSGDELVDAGEGGALSELLSKNGGKLPFGRVVDSNRPMLLAAVQQSLPFCEAVDLGIVRDEYEVVRDALAAASERCHIVLTSGGVSMGAKDAIKPALKELAKVHFGRVLMKPGKPLTFATRSASNCFVALPGNPVSCFVCFHLAVAVAARKLAGFAKEDLYGKMVQARLSDAVRLDAVRPEYHRASLRWVDGTGYEAVSTGKQASSRLLSARSADALLALPAQEGTLPAGSVVSAVLL